MKNILSIGFLFLMTSCTKPAKPVYAGYENFHIEKIGLQNSIVGANLKLYNPNSYDLQLKRADADVYFDERFLGHVYLDTFITLRMMDTTHIPLSMQSPTKDILAQSGRLLLNPNVRVKIKGNVKAGRSGFFINVPINYEGNQYINLNGQGKDTVITPTPNNKNSSDTMKN